MKTCTRCKQDKETSEFYDQIQKSKNGNKSWHYLDSMCKKCRGDYSSERKRKVKLEAIAYKGGKCSIESCGLVDSPEVYDFHHLNPNEKDFCISDQSKSLDKIKAELDKCILVCSNCHRKLHKRI